MGELNKFQVNIKSGTDLIKNNLLSIEIERILVDGCLYCKHNKDGIDAGLWCINNCIKGNKFSKKNMA